MAPEEELLFCSSLWGPSCDTLDQVLESCLLPELQVGDWLIFSGMGSLSHGQPTALSHPDKPPVFYTIATADWYVPLGMDTHIQYAHRIQCMPMGVAGYCLFVCCPLSVFLYI